MSRQRKRRLALERRVSQMEALIKDMQTTLGLRRLGEACGEEMSPVGQVEKLRQYQAWWHAQQRAQQLLQNQPYQPGQITWIQGGGGTSVTSSVGSLMGTALSNIGSVSGITKTTT